MSDTIEEARWRVYDLFREQVHTDKGRVDDQQVVDTQETRAQSIPDSHHPAPESLITGRKRRGRVT